MDTIYASIEILVNELIITDDIEFSYIKIFNYYNVSKLNFSDDKIIATTNKIRKIFLQNQKYDYAKNIFNFILEFRNNNKLLEESIIKTIENDDIEFIPYLIDYDLANTLFFQLNYAEAAVIYEKILQAIDNNFNPVHSKRIKIMYNLGLIYYHSNNYLSASVFFLFIHKHLNIICSDKDEMNKAEELFDEMFYKMGKIFIKESKILNALEMFNLVFYYNKQKNNNLKYKIDIMFELSYLYYKLGRFYDAEINSISMNNIMINSKIFGLNHPDTIRNMYSLGVIYYEQNKYDLALLQMISVYSIRKKNLGINNIGTIKVMYQLGCIYYKLKQYDNGINKLKSAFKHMKEKHDLNDTLTMDIKYCLGNIFLEQKNYEKARYEYIFILNRWDTQLKSNNIYMLQVYDKIAFTYYNQEKYEFAKIAWFRGLDSLDKEFCDKNIIYNIYYYVALAFYKLDELNEAEKIFKDIYVYYCYKFTSLHSKSILIKHLLLRIYTQKHMQYIIKNKKIIDKITPLSIECKNKIATLSVAFKMGIIYYYQDNFEFAINIFNNLITYQQHSNESNIAETINTIYNLGCIYYKMNNLEKTIELFNNVLTIQSSILNYAIENVIYIVQNLALLYYKQKKFNDALIACEQILDYQKEKLGINHLDTIFTIKLIQEIL